MDRDKILKIAEQLSQNTMSCCLAYQDKINDIKKISNVNIYGNKIEPTLLKEYFENYKVGVNCVIEKFVFQPKDKEFLVTIHDGVITCSKYANERDVELVTNVIKKLLL